MSHTIEFVIFPDAMGLDIMGPLEVFNTATLLLAQQTELGSGYKMRFVAASKGPVRLNSGLEIMASESFSNKEPVGTLLIPGGPGVDAMLADPDFMEYIKTRSRQADRVMSVCKGAFLLAATGILDGKKATTHWMIADELAAHYPQVGVQSEEIFTREDNIYTSAGVTTGIDLALAVVEEDFGVSVAMEVARMLVLYYRRPGTQAQYSAPLKAQEKAGEGFSELHNWLVKHLNSEISVTQMANFTAMSARNFARAFKKSTGTTPNKYLETLRLDRAREIMVTGNESLENIAAASGFGREERLRRAFQSHACFMPAGC